MSIDNQIADIKARINSAQMQQVRNEVNRESAQKARDAAMASLASEFGVDTLADARAKLAELQQDLDDKVTAITKILDELDL